MGSLPDERAHREPAGSWPKMPASCAGQLIEMRDTAFREAMTIKKMAIHFPRGYVRPSGHLLGRQLPLERIARLWDRIQRRKGGCRAEQTAGWEQRKSSRG